MIKCLKDNTLKWNRMSNSNPWRMYENFSTEISYIHQMQKCRKKTLIQKNAGFHIPLQKVILITACKRFFPHKAKLVARIKKNNCKWIRLWEQFLILFHIWAIKSSIIVEFEKHVWVKSFFIQLLSNKKKSFIFSNIWLHSRD